jgi:NTE family protein
MADSMSNFRPIDRDTGFLLPPPNGAFTLVLGGGGVAGIAWMTGFLMGLADIGLDLRSAGRIIGTSAGSTVGAQLWSGLSLEELFARQVDARQRVREISPPRRQLAVLLEVSLACAEIADPLEKRQRLGRLAMDSHTVSEAERRAVIAGRLPSHHWPARPLQLTAIDAESGALRIFDAEANINLVDAVAASCAVPGVWPPVAIGDHRYIDGGMRSADNADLATGDASVIILSPIGGLEQGRGESTLATEITTLETGGARVIAVQPDPEARSAMGSNALDPSIQPAAALAGRTQGRNDAARLGDWVKCGPILESPPAL